MLNDVRNEFVSERAAREDYGVVFTGTPLVVDEAVTTALRQQMRRERKWDDAPVYNWGTQLAAE